MKRLKNIIGVIIALILAFAYAHIAKPNNIYDKKVDNSEYLSTGVVCEGAIEQKFVCVEDSLDGVKAKVQVIGDVRDVQVKYSLIDNQLGESVAMGEVSAAEIKPSKFFEFTFDTVNNTRGKEYTIIFENKNADENRGIGIFFQPRTQKGTELTISDNRTEGTLILKTITDRFDFETFAVLLVFVIYTVVLQILY